ncbi:MAG: PocR ligand-binding domain-containing protein [Planctomycetota bacterium]
MKNKSLIRNRADDLSQVSDGKRGMPEIGEAPASRNSAGYDEHAQAAATPQSIDGRYSINDLIDIDKLKFLFEEFCRATGFSTGIVSFPAQEKVIATGERKICTNFHRTCPELAQRCRKNELSLTKSKNRQPDVYIRCCDMGLVVAVTPIVIRGTHMASLFTGQVFCDPPDMEWFRDQGRRHGFDMEKYLDAIREIPVASKQELQTGLTFLNGIASMIAEQSLNALEIKEGAQILEAEVQERKRVELALRESEEKFRALIEHSMDMTMIIDSGRSIQYASPAFESTVGLETREVWGEKLDHFIHPEDLPVIEDAFNRIIEQPGASVQIPDFRIRLKGGKWRILQGSFTNMLDVPGVNGIVGNHYDVSERRRAEKENHLLEAQIQHAQKLESLGVLAGGMAHDFNNLLTAILGNAELTMMELPKGSALWRNINEIKKATLRAAELCEQMLIYSGRGRLLLHRVNLSDVVREMACRLDSMVTHDLTIRYCLDDDLPWSEADTVEIQKAIMGMITNAAEAIGDRQGVITITTFVKEFLRHDLKECYLDNDLREGRYACIEIADTGCGMDQATQSRIFDPFFTTKFTGRGLGMAAILGTVRSHKGAIKVRSEIDRGTVFTLYFPALTSCQKQPDSLPGTGESPEAEFMGEETLLLVDDEVPIVDCGKIMLERMGFKVLTACNGVEALEMVRARGEEIACIILDLTMPCMDGQDAFDEIHKIRPELPVLVSSGYSVKEIESRFEGKNVAGIIQKPFLTATLRNKLQPIISRACRTGKGKTRKAEAREEIVNGA